MSIQGDGGSVTISGNTICLSERDLKLTKLLLKANQEHIFLNWFKNEPPNSPFPLSSGHPGVRTFFDQVDILNKSYPGGIGAYINKAKRLLKQTSNNKRVTFGLDVKKNGVIDLGWTHIH